MTPFHDLSGNIAQTSQNDSILMGVLADPTPKPLKHVFIVFYALSGHSQLLKSDSLMETVAPQHEV